MENQISKMSLDELKSRAYDLIAIVQSANGQLQVINNEIANRGTKVEKQIKEQMELPLEYKDEPLP